ncbi:MAG: phosphohydrolase [Muribaculaceae bacterium]|nr:phosphohydrolase [Muribaculaceae bacterium]
MADILTRFYTPGTPLYDTLVLHSEAVARKALHCLEARRIHADADFIYEAAMLHDIGIIHTHAPSIHCTGPLPYICHGIEGRKMLDDLALHRHALVCERHTGAGLTVDDIIAQNFPLPRRDMTPRTVEERLVCYADKFFSKSGNLTAEKPLDRVIASMEAHGPDTLARFLALHEEFAP